MKEKLLRNTTDEKWRNWWDAVHAAASNAPTLRYEEKAPSGETRRRSSTRESAKPRKK